MQLYRWIAGAVMAAILFAPSSAGASPALPNLDQLKTAITTYYKSGNYTADVAAVEADASRYIDKRVAAGVKKPAIVFDIDDTALLTLGYELTHGFAYTPDSWNAYAATTGFPAIAPTLALSKHARLRGVAVFFVTGRPTTQTAMTAKALAGAGYTYVHLYLRSPGDNRKSVVPYKSSERAAIEAQGYTVLETIGDQWSDLKGGHAERAFKLPNPMYYIP
jgi:predicted secreted acid phosphatase